ncbi:MAG: PilN domain-containing protein [candidate division Zixibacteria bacterium]|nr:PilN domain-containing protein [candidate division Zixibacteria bacterium]
MMIEINLLPKEFQKKRFNLSFGKSGAYAAIGVIGILVMLAGVTLYQMQQLTSLDARIKIANKRAAMLKKDIKVVDALIDVKNKVKQRMAAVERLDSHRSTWVRILNDFAKIVPDFVWLGRIEEVSDKKDDKKKGASASQNKATAKPAIAKGGLPTVRPVKIEGYAFTLNALASFMIKMMRSDYFDEVELTSTSEVTFENHKAHNFVINANLHYLSDDEMRQMIASALGTKKRSSPKTSHKKLN